LWQNFGGICEGNSYLYIISSLSNRPNGFNKKGEGKGKLLLQLDIFLRLGGTLISQSCYFRGSCELKKILSEIPAGSQTRSKPSSQWI